MAILLNTPIIPLNWNKKDSERSLATRCTLWRVGENLKKTRPLKLQNMRAKQRRPQITVFLKDQLTHHLLQHHHLLCQVSSTPLRWLRQWNTCWKLIINLFTSSMRPIVKCFSVKHWAESEILLSSLSTWPQDINPWFVFSYHFTLWGIKQAVANVAAKFILLLCCIPSKTYRDKSVQIWPQEEMAVGRWTRYWISFIEWFHFITFAPPLFQGAHLRGGVRSTSSRLREDLQAVVYISKILRTKLCFSNSRSTIPSGWRAWLSK